MNRKQKMLSSMKVLNEIYTLCDDLMWAGNAEEIRNQMNSCGDPDDLDRDVTIKMGWLCASLPFAKAKDKNKIIKWARRKLYLSVAWGLIKQKEPLRGNLIGLWY